MPTQRRLPPLKSMQAFEAFGRLGSMTAAADALGVTVGAVSQHIRKLEEELAAHLVNRNGNNVGLTSGGVELLAFLSRGFDEFRGGISSIAAIKTATRLTVSSLRSVATRWVGPRLFEWQNAHPDAKTRLRGDMEEPNLNNGLVDFRITYGRHVQCHSQYVRLFTDEVVPVCSPARWAKQKVTRPADLLKMTLIGIEWADAAGQSPGWTEWARVFCERDHSVEAGVTFSFTNAALDAALYGEGFVLGQRCMIADDVAAGRLIVPFDLALPMPEPYYLAWAAEAFDKPLGRKFHEWIVGKGQLEGKRRGSGCAPSVWTG